LASRTIRSAVAFVQFVVRGRHPVAGVDILEPIRWRCIRPPGLAGDFNMAALRGGRRLPCRGRAETRHCLTRRSILSLEAVFAASQVWLFLSGNLKLPRFIGCC